MDYSMLESLLGGPTPEEKKQLAADAMLNFGLLTLANNTNKRNGMQAIAQGGLGAMQGYRQGQQDLMQGKLQNFKLQQMLEEVKAKQAQQAAQSEFAATLPPEMQKLASAYPQMVPQLLSQEKKRHVVGNAMIDDNGNVLYQGQEKPQQAPALVQEIEAWRNMPEGPQKDLLGKILQSKAQGQQSQPYYTPIPTENGLGSFNNRTGQMTMVGGGGVVKPSDSPDLQAKIAGAKAGATAKAEASAKRDINMSGLGDIIGEAETILQGKAGAKPTGSAVGAGVDSVLGGIGVSTESANQAAKLKALGGALVMKMPRMEGPQSDKDTMLYKEMAGEVGNPMRPIAQRLAALEAIKNLNKKYAGQSAQTGGVKFLGFE